ncbi:hypothetical protein MHK_001697, partial [Candidatus Magnetomorum sp. HK-1]
MDSTLLKNIIVKILNNNMNISKLDSKEKELFFIIKNQTSDNSALKRFFQSISFREKLSSYFHDVNTGHQNKNKVAPFKESFFKTKQLFKEGLVSFSEWISPLWQPRFAGQLVTASDIPEQKHTFRMNEGDIQLSCLWRGSYKNTQAYIK